MTFECKVPFKLRRTPSKNLGRFIQLFNFFVRFYPTI